MKRALQAYDTLDDRREIIHLLKRLPPLLRVRWLEECCRRAFIPKTRTRPHVSPKLWARAEASHREEALSEGITVECFIDFWTMAANYSLDVDEAMLRLERTVKNYARIMRA